MSPLTLLHLTFVGLGKPAASVEFHPRLTVIYGASDTGKSFIVDAIDYMLGASSLKTIREAEGYSEILLGLRLPDGQVVTLSRWPEAATKVGIRHRDVRSLSPDAPDEILAVRHNAKAENNLSRYLLRLLGADGRMVLKNARRERRSLSFRDLAHLCIISESQMAGIGSPVLTSGQKTNETVEKSVFKFLLTGQDEAPESTATSDVERKIGKGKIELLDRLIAEARNNLISKTTEAELRDALARLEAATADASAATSGLVAERSRLTERARALQESSDENRRRTGEVQALLGRFGLLRQQYDSDLDRLQLVAEAGNLLGYFDAGPCAFCGAAPEHQLPGHRLAETTQLSAAVSAEMHKTTELRADLLTTMDDLSDQVAALEAEHLGVRVRVAALDEDLAGLDRRLAPLRSDTEGLLAARTRIQSDLTIHSQIRRFEELKSTLSNAPAPPTTRADGIAASDLAAFEKVVEQTLHSWQVPGDNSVSYDQASAEISVGGRPRHSRGKGMRSIIHAAFSTALARYATTRQLVHPGFVVLDSPVLTYREPHDSDVQLTHNVVEHFYRNLLNDPPAQVVVVENGNPPDGLDADAATYAFHTAGSSRAGFFPRR